MKKCKNIAIIFFSLSAEKQAGSKALLASNFRANKQISESLIFETQKAIEKSQLPIFHYNQNNQKGASFGEKLANAYQEVFDLGYKAVISVGNDSPEISKVKWDYIISKLQRDENIVGPNLRGGTYLIGLSKKHFEKKSFAALPWQSTKLFAKLFQYCDRHCLSTTILEKIRDINTVHDLKIFIRKPNAFSWFYQLVKLILSAEIIKYFKEKVHFKSFVVLPGAPFRAPPKSFN